MAAKFVAAIDHGTTSTRCILSTTRAPLDQESTRREAASRGDLLFGTPDTWLLWNLTGGPNGGVHATDPTNASRPPS